MADETGGTHGTDVESVNNVSAGSAIVQSDQFENPGLPPHRPRVTDLEPSKEALAERRVTALFFLSVVGSVLAVAFYFAFPIKAGDMGSVRLSTVSLGLSLTLGLFGIGIGAVHWAKALMADAEITELRHEPNPVTQAKAVEVFTLGNKESGIGRRPLIRNSLIAAIALFPIPAIFMFRDLAPAQEPNELLRHTMWAKGTRLTRDPYGTPIKADEVVVGSVFHVIPEGLEEKSDALEEKAKAAVLLMRLRPEDLHQEPSKKSWSYDGIVAYSKICTHVGCPVALYEQQTHHLLCPCHQSQFDVSNGAAVIFGPASRPLPQLPIAIDADGYLVAQSDFHEPVGPSFWERRK